LGDATEFECGLTVRLGLAQPGRLQVRYAALELVTQFAIEILFQPLGVDHVP
jgi:hypothetical protein